MDGCEKQVGRHAKGAGGQKKYADRREKWAGKHIEHAGW